MKRTHCFEDVDDKENVPAQNLKKPNTNRNSTTLKPKSKAQREMDGLASRLECPICFNAFTSKVFVCSNGHSLCDTCFHKIRTKCPSCRTPLNGARNRSLEDIIAHTVLPCRYRDYGCELKGKGAARSSHETLCVHRPIRCLFHRCYPQCKWYGAPSELLDHLNSHCVVRKVSLDFISDVYWSYETKERCWQRGKDATFFIPSLNRFYYVSISRQNDHFHLAIVWLPTTDEAAKDLKLKMELTIPLENGQKITYTVKPPRLDSGMMMDENVKTLIREGQSYIIPIRRWRSQWLEERKKFYFKISAKWKKEYELDKFDS